VASIPTSFHYATKDGSAHAGTNYKATSGTVTFPAFLSTVRKKKKAMKRE
jgi:hypothetical protein